MTYQIRKYRSWKDFKFGRFRLEMKPDGGYIVYGILKKTNQSSKYHEISRDK